MATFKLNFTNRQPLEVSGDTIGTACLQAGLSIPDLHQITSYEIEGQRTEVSATAGCHCVYHAEQDLACIHDLRLHGLITDQTEAHRLMGDDMDFVETQDSEQEDQPSADDFAAHDRYWDE